MIPAGAAAIHLAFDLVAWGVAAAIGLVLYRWRLSDATLRLARVAGPGYYASLAAGAAIGAWAAGSINSLLGPAANLSHSIVGALAGAILGVEAYKAFRRIQGSTGGVFVGPFAAGAAVGRLGCFFAGLPDGTYGAPTRLPWGVDFGDGVLRHPVQLYEAGAMVSFLALYVAALAARAPWALRRGFYALAIVYGVQRFAWEFLKPYPKLIGPLNLFHLLSAGLIAYGWIYWRRADAQERALPVPRSDHEPLRGLP